MEKDTQQLLLRASQEQRWEEGERATYDLKALENEFLNRLYPTRNEGDPRTGETKPIEATSLQG